MTINLNAWQDIELWWVFTWGVQNKFGINHCVHLSGFTQFLRLVLSIVFSSKSYCAYIWDKSSSVPCLLGDLSNTLIIHIAFICISVTHTVEGTKTVVAVFLRRAWSNRDQHCVQHKECWRSSRDRSWVTKKSVNII